MVQLSTSVTTVPQDKPIPKPLISNFFVRFSWRFSSETIVSGIEKEAVFPNLCSE
jgi:hypothetical protein